MDAKVHQSQLVPADNKFHVGNGGDGKHYWLTPPALYAQLHAEFSFTFDPCPYPLPAGFDGLTQPWGSSSYVNPPFGSILHQGPGDKKPKKKGPTAWVRKAIAEREEGKRVVLVYPVDKWLLMLLAAGAKVRNLGDVRWHATEDGSEGKGTGRHIACFVLEPPRRIHEWKPDKECLLGEIEVIEKTLRRQSEANSGWSDECRNCYAGIANSLRGIIEEYSTAA